MLTGNKKDIYKLLPFVSPRLAQALAYIAATDFSQIPNGEYEIDGRKVFARVNTYDTTNILMYSMWLRAAKQCGTLP